MKNSLETQYRPDYVVPPGATIAETIEAFGISQAELADRLGMSLPTVNKIIKGKAPISPETAIALERVIGISAGFWNRYEASYREFLAKQEETEKLGSLVEWVKRFPVKDMVKLGMVREQSSPVAQLQELLRFFGIASPNQWDGMLQVAGARYRESKSFERNPAAVAAWLRRGELEAQQIECEPYDEAKLKRMVPELRALTLLDAAPMQERLQSICASCGVAVVFVPELPGTKLFGAARWITPTKALVQLSLRRKQEDHFWFTFFHELAHILFHGKRSFFLDEENGLTQSEEENEADAWAAEVLIPERYLKDFLFSGKPSLLRIERFAREIKIAPGIVVGRLQKLEVLDWSVGNKLKRTFVWRVEE